MFDSVCANEVPSLTEQYNLWYVLAKLLIAIVVGLLHNIVVCVKTVVTSN